MGKSERFEMRLRPEFTALVDEWRRAQPDIPTRSEAIRRLAELGCRNDTMFDAATLEMIRLLRRIGDRGQLTPDESEEVEQIVEDLCKLDTTFRKRLGRCS